MERPERKTEKMGSKLLLTEKDGLGISTYVSEWSDQSVDLTY